MDFSGMLRASKVTRAVNLQEHKPPILPERKYERKEPATPEGKFKREFLQFTKSTRRELEGFIYGDIGDGVDFSSTLEYIKDTVFCTSMSVIENAVMKNTYFIIGGGHKCSDAAEYSANTIRLFLMRDDRLAKGTAASFANVFAFAFSPIIKFAEVDRACIENLHVWDIRFSDHSIVKFMQDMEYRYHTYIDSSGWKSNFDLCLMAASGIFINDSVRSGAINTEYKMLVKAFADTFADYTGLRIFTGNIEQYFIFTAENTKKYGSVKFRDVYHLIPYRVFGNRRIYKNKVLDRKYHTEFDIQNCDTEDKAYSFEESLLPIIDNRFSVNFGDFELANPTYLRTAIGRMFDKLWTLCSYNDKANDMGYKYQVAEEHVKDMLTKKFGPEWEHDIRRKRKDLDDVDYDNVYEGLSFWDIRYNAIQNALSMKLRQFGFDVDSMPGICISWSHVFQPKMPFKSGSRNRHPYKRCDSPDDVGRSVYDMIIRDKTRYTDEERMAVRKFASDAAEFACWFVDGVYPDYYLMNASIGSFYIDYLALKCICLCTKYFEHRNGQSISVMLTFYARSGFSSEDADIPSKAYSIINFDNTNDLWHDAIFAMSYYREKTSRKNTVKYKYMCDALRALGKDNVISKIDNIQDWDKKIVITQAFTHALYGDDIDAVINEIDSIANGDLYQNSVTYLRDNVDHLYKTLRNM